MTADPNVPTRTDPSPCAPTVAWPAAPGSWLGVLGGGQLGRMFVHAAQVHGYRVCVLEPDPASPAGAAADRHLRAAYTDAAALQTLAGTCTAVTTEFENVPAASLQRLAAQCGVSPPAAAVQVCQDRAEEKRCFQLAGVPCAPFRVIDDATGCGDALPAQQAAEGAAATPPAAAPHTPLGDLLPGILKTARMGYDGKGQRSVNSPAELAAAWVVLGRVPCVLERRLPLAAEISVILARGADGRMVHLPPQHNLHRNGILAATQVPAPGIAEATLQQAVALAGRLAQALHYVGVLCVEFFVLADGTLVANEMAPRPHNSGHYSIDACDVSQFDLQVRTLAGLPLVQPRLHSAAVMLNLLGDLWLAGAGSEAAHPQVRAPDWAAVLALPGTRLHLYGKAEPRIGRKMGHLTVTAPQLGQAQQVAREAAQRLGLPAF